LVPSLIFLGPKLAFIPALIVSSVVFVVLPAEQKEELANS